MTLRDTIEGGQRLFAAGHGFPIRGTRRGTVAGLRKIRHRLLPRVRPERVVRELLHLLAEAIRGEALELPDDVRVQGPPALAE